MSRTARDRTIWIDLDNSPHVPFFIPIIDELEKKGYTVFLTSRDAYQVTQLVDLFALPCKRVGRHYGKHKIMKVLGSCYRAVQLLLVARRENLCLAVSHGSRPQMLAAAIRRVPSILIMDYEFARRLTVLNPTWVMIPEVIPDNAFAVPQEIILKYPGIKEDVYVPRFRPDPAIKSSLGLGENQLVATIRPPASEAHYHDPKSDELFHATINFLAESSDINMIVLPRNEKQEIFIREQWPELLNSRKIVIPDRAINGLDLLWFSDFVISGGGTMNREAAALGVPVYSIFRGTIGAVDRYLAKTDRLTLVESVADIRIKIKLVRRERIQIPGSSKNETLMTIVENIDSIIRKKHPAERMTQ